MKRWVFDPVIIIVIAAALFAFWQLTQSLFQQGLASRFDEAYASYSAGEKASNITDRQKDFNRALELYSALEDEYHPTIGNGKLTTT